MSEPDSLVFDCDLCGRVFKLVYLCEDCMAQRCEACNEVHGCNCPPFVI